MIDHSAWSRCLPSRANDFLKMPSRTAPTFFKAPLPRPFNTAALRQPSAHHRLARMRPARPRRRDIRTHRAAARRHYRARLTAVAPHDIVIVLVVAPDDGVVIQIAPDDIVVVEVAPHDVVVVNRVAPDDIVVVFAQSTEPVAPGDVLSPDHVVVLGRSP